MLAGILLLENNKTYGRTENKKRFLYKCIPDDKRLPAFLVPYDIKLGFSKDIRDKYVVFRFDQWNNLHPRGMLIEVLGDVNNLECFYEYKLYCRNLNDSTKEFTKKTHRLFHIEKTEEYIQKILHNPDFIIEDRSKDFVFTIDPKNSSDYDDGFSIHTNDDGTKIVSIYIANVFFWMETFGLWESFQKRVATIYLPDRRRPMLPTILSDNLCSLLAGHKRFAFCMDIIFSNDDSTPKISFSNVLVCVKRNFVYEDYEMFKNKHYQDLFELTKQFDSSVMDSHGVVAYWMVYMNKTCGNHMFNNKTGIFRSVYSKNSMANVLDSCANMSIETRRVIYSWNSMCGQYVVYSEDARMDHDLLNVKSYVHMTSPIRRLVDLLNQIFFLVKFSLIRNLSSDAYIFLNKWVSDIDGLNEKMKSTVKVERECEMMRKCLTRPDMLSHPHDVYVINIREISPNLFKYTVYLEEEKIVLEMKSEEKKSIYKKYKIHMYKIESYGVASKIKLGWYE
jgi:exoribonuclease R